MVSRVINQCKERHLSTLPKAILKVVRMSLSVPHKACKKTTLSACSTMISVRGDRIIVSASWSTAHWNPPCFKAMHARFLRRTQLQNMTVLDPFVCSFMNAKSAASLEPRTFLCDDGDVGAMRCMSEWSRDLMHSEHFLCDEMTRFRQL